MTFFGATNIYKKQNQVVLLEVIDMIILKIFAALLCSGTDPAGICLVRQWPDDGRHDVPRPKRMPYKKAVPKGQKPLGSHPFSHPTSPLPPPSAHEHP